MGMPVVDTNCSHSLSLFAKRLEAYNLSGASHSIIARFVFYVILPTIQSAWGMCTKAGQLTTSWLQKWLKHETSATYKTLNFSAQVYTYKSIASSNCQCRLSEQRNRLPRQRDLSKGLAILIIRGGCWDVRSPKGQGSSAKQCHSQLVRARQQKKNMNYANRLIQNACPRICVLDWTQTELGNKVRMILQHVHPKYNMKNLQCEWFGRQLGRITRAFPQLGRIMHFDDSNTKILQPAQYNCSVHGKTLKIVTARSGPHTHAWHIHTQR